MKKPGTKVPGFVFLKLESLLSNAERKIKPEMSAANVRLFHLGHPLEVRRFCEFMKQKWQSSHPD
jgi:hypothetical protein